jgi:cell wall-associated NlpC family hydrolase
MKSRVAIILAFLFAAPVAFVTPAQADERGMAANINARIGSLVDSAGELALSAMGFIGIPYRLGGAAPETGFDCSGLVQYVFREVAGLVLPRSSFDQIHQGTAVAREDLQPGDLVFFNTMRATASHVGIYIGDNRFIHAPRRGKTVEIADFNNTYWQAHYDGARRMPI